MKLILYREDLQDEFSKLDYDEIRFKHFKTYAQNAVLHCAVVEFANNDLPLSVQHKEIRPTKENE